MAQNNSCNYKPTLYNVQTGAASGALNDVAPSATSGVPLISQGSSAQPIFGTAVVAGGGTGVASFTAYSLVAAGTTSTGTMQSVGTGSSGQILRSGGSSALPAWSTATYPATAGTSGNVLTSDGTNWSSSAPTTSTKFSACVATTTAINPADATTYFVGYNQAVSAAGYAACVLVMPIAGTINKCYVKFIVSGTLASTETSTIYLRKNNTTDTSITSSVNLSSATPSYSNTSMGISVSAGDFISIKWVAPTWATNPTSVFIGVSFYVE